MSDSTKSFESKVIFVASVLGLFLELALIRWVSCEIRIFAYFKNLVLIACFLGFGSGCLLYRRPRHILRALLLLLVLCLLIQLQWQPLIDYGPRRISRVLAEMPGLMVFYGVDPVLSWSGATRLTFAIAWTLILFAMLAMLMVPIGQMIAAAMAEMPDRPIRAYSINVAGSLVGILAYTLMAAIALPPVCWFVTAGLLFVYLDEDRTVRFEGIAVVLALTLVLLPNNSPNETVTWSPYQKLALLADGTVAVNNTGYQKIQVQPSTTKDKNFPITRSVFPFLFRRVPGDVLIVGAGTGNDVAAAIGAGARSVTAVDIDPVIVDIGRALHPQKPYDDPRVTVVIDDARHFIRTTRRKFDLIIFSHLDSHTVLSSYTNVRLDDYIYTVESLRDARTRLKPGGWLFLSFFAEQPYVAARLAQNLNAAFGHEPIPWFGIEQRAGGRILLANFFTSEPESMPLIVQAASQARLRPSPSIQGNRVVPSSDAWPFLTLASPQIPVLVLLLSTIIIVLCSVFIWRVRPPGEVFRGRVFWLGAAFLLVEVHNVSRLALCFGTTWQVNAWVIGVILGVILVANAVAARIHRRTAYPPPWVSVGLFATLAAAYFVPLEAFLSLTPPLGGLAATILLTLPIFFAGVLFADAFAGSASPSFALGWNILGAVIGGMAESLSYVFGIPSLILVAAAFYAFAIVWPTPVRRAEVDQAASERAVARP
jgi:spermidine synthase